MADAEALNARMLAELEAASDDGWLPADIEHPPILDRGQAAKQLGDDATAVPIYERALALSRQHGDLHSAQMALRPLGIMAARRGDHAGAARLLAEGVRAGATLGDRSCTLATLAFVAYEALAVGRPERAARLLGFLTACWDRAGHRAMGLHGIEEAVARCRADLGDAAFEAAWAAGRAMSHEEGFAYGMALEDTPTSASDPTAP